ncbi:hypothetical protein [Pedobacter alpinus]|uniref:CarboxypepD_reg-like domain-containing protein n=1 Tax=Pedobacter alpinus TaxID=1590643 RepID=A0ABW5TNL0_9SPHI
MKPFLYFFIFCCFSLKLFAQQEPLGGLVFDKDTKNRLNRVSITNLRTKQLVYNNVKGEFFINAQPGDILISTLNGYKTDTLQLRNQNSIIIYLQRRSIPLPEVVFKDSVLMAKAKYEEAKKAFNQAVRLGDNSDILNISNGGVGLDIDALWSIFSKEGKNARKLMETMERDYQNNMVDQIFNKNLVTKITGLKGEKLVVFMLNYKPSYAFVIKANEYSLISYIKQSYAMFKMNPNPFDLSSLKAIPVQ